VSRILQTKDLKVFYGDFQAVFGIDFHIDEGETVAIIGANGAGKSSFLKALTGMVPSNRDDILFDGQPVGHGMDLEQRESNFLSASWRSLLRVLKHRRDEKNWLSVYNVNSGSS
jgi:ABC-type branched-subunit amino acid transport system ATPase component